MNIRNILTVVTLVIASSGIFAQTAKEISDKASNIIDFKAMEMSLTLKIYDTKGRERVRQISTASKNFGEINKTIMKFTAPPDVKGTSILIYDYENKDDDMWIYMPAIRKTRRIVSSEKGKSFMGSEFTNADMSKPNMNDFDYKIISSETYKGHSCWKIETTCKDEDIEDENGFSKKIAWIEKKTYLCHKIEFYDFAGELYKIQSIEQYKKQSNNKYFAFYMKMENEQNARKSIMTINKFQLGSKLTESTFTPAMLKK
ncbi:MAG: RND transporter [Bacteroidetes bacterium]|nr:MAG: RND transporter [Bacteroidota bacterium]RLD75523.1 MAG: RND transporter [Bacteroidota bacterium]